MAVKWCSMRSTGFHARWVILTIGLVTILVILTACADKNAQSVSSDEPMPSLTQGPLTQVTGIVTDAAGKPLANVGIGVSKGTAPVPEVLVLSDQDGKYTWNLPAGTFTLTANSDGYQALSQEVTVKYGKTVQLNFKLDKLP